ncbi:sulfite oxidase [Neobacillus citreus]|uniref:Sulfite oxidase n=1 Tax=Neobacillus citreus TaxID=2833578 RepID=A0A942YBC0_9BACI|nr:sulfite oxidase [Neobacillus citreus]MCH6264277.1 sulfite oxidase [Neobacillus citreus]
MYPRDPFFKNKPYLTTRSLQPDNQETPIHFLENGETPTGLTYRRNHFPFPTLSTKSYYLTITGSVKTPITIQYNQITTMPSRTVTAVVECSGNKRAHFRPKVFGEQWKDGAISQGTWKGVPLFHLLQIAGVQDSVHEVVFEGNDSGIKKGQHVPFVRSLPLKKAMEHDVIVAWEHNHKQISPKHGFPFRLIVPGWYGMASVKWLKTIRVVDHPFSGPFQTDDYVYYPHKNNNEEAVPVTVSHVNSIIQQPLDRQILQLGQHEIKGLAWTGEGVVISVEVSVDDGETWKTATLHGQPRQFQWIKWSYSIVFEKNREYSIKVRAYDSNGHLQPDTAFWNQKGYGYNAVSQIKIKVE